ncbi:MAG: clostripain-related cysteine peptidase, partial [bacterium]
RRGQIEIMAEAEETGSDIDRREARTIRADEYLDVPLQFDSKYGLGDFSTNRRLWRNDNRVVVEDVWLEPWGRQPSQRRIYSKPAKLFSLAPLALSSEVTCGNETDLKEGLCVAGGGSCPAWRIASIGGCKLCPDGLSPNKSKTVCEDKGCKKNYFWDAVSQSCVDDRDKRRSRWVQMNLVGGFPDEMMDSIQNVQLELLRGQVKAYAEQKSRSRDYVNVVGKITGWISPEPPPGGYSEVMTDQCGPDIEFAKESGLKSYCKEVGGISYQQSVIEKKKGYESGLAAESYWVSEPEWRETVNYDEAYDGNRVSWPGVTRIDNATILRGILQRGLALAEKEPAVFALNLSGHGIGVRSAEVDIRDIREIIGDEMQGAPLDLVTFDSCRMGAYEALLMLEGRAKWVVAHTTSTPLEGWNPEGIGLAILGEEAENKKGKLVAAGKGMRVAEMIEHMMDEISTQKDGEVVNKVGWMGSTEDIRFDSVVAYQMDRFANFREAFNDVLRGLTEKLRETPEGTLKKLSEIRKIGANEVKSGEKSTDFYHVDDFLQEISKAFDEDAVVKTASNRATIALKRLTRKKPDYDEPRMIFGWCGFNPIDRVESRDLCNTSLAHFVSSGPVYSDPTLKVLYDFNKAMRDAMMR